MGLEPGFIQTVQYYLAVKRPYIIISYHDYPTLPAVPAEIPAQTRQYLSPDIDRIAPLTQLHSHNLAGKIRISFSQIFCPFPEAPQRSSPTFAQDCNTDYLCFPPLIFSSIRPGLPPVDFSTRVCSALFLETPAGLNISDGFDVYNCKYFIYSILCDALIPLLLAGSV